MDDAQFELTPEEAAESITTRLEIIMDAEALARVRDARVLVLGLGGVGSACAMSLARGGVGHLVLLDRDVVKPSNINRQVVARTSTIGRVKAEVMRELVLDVNPEADVLAVHEYLASEDVAAQLDALPRPGFVVDAIDTIAQKLRIAAWAQERGVRLVSSMGAANKLDPTQLRFADISKTSHDPMSKIMRKECRKRGIKKLQVLYSPEPPLPVERPEGVPQEGRVPDKGTILGTMSYLPPVMGLMLASHVIRELAWPGTGRPEAHA